MNILSFAEVPHSYVTENPKKDVQKVETFKQREKAELNLSVTKLKTKEIEGKLINGKLVFDITDKKDIQEGNILVTQGTPYKPNNVRIKGANPIKILEYTKEVDKLEVTGENLQDVYVNVLDSKGQVARIYKNIKNYPSFYSYTGHILGNLEIGTSYIEYEISDEYEGAYFHLDDYNNYCGKGMKYIKHSNYSNERNLFPFIRRRDRGYFARIGQLKMNDIMYWEARKLSSSEKNENNQYYVVGYDYSTRHNNNWIPNKIKINEELEIEIKTYSSNDLFDIKLIKFPKKNFQLKWYAYGIRDNGYFSTSDSDYGTWHSKLFLTSATMIINFKYIPSTLKGNSTLTFAEYYPVNEFVQFTANPTIQNAQPLALDNSVRDVTLETTGKGLVTMQQGDKLTIDGHEVVIGAGGNIGSQKLTIGNVKYTYEVKNGKFRIALNEWGVLEPDRTIPIKIVRNENGKDKSLAEHNLTIKAPRKVEGTSNIKLNQDYDIRSIIKFNGISLKAPGKLQLESTTAGVSLTSTAGQGIPFMKEGDRLEISDGLTKAVKTFTIGANGTLDNQQVKLNNGELTVFVEGGKFRVGVNNWLVNNLIKSNVRLVRGTNEIMNHTLDIKVPDAPFNIKKNGLLDFGNVTAGSKRTAETDIVLEMVKDVSDVKFSLKDPQPMLENLGTGDTLKVNRIEYLVSKQDKRDYKVKLKGNLTIPEGIKSGLYTGSTLLELKIK